MDEKIDFYLKEAWKSEAAASEVSIAELEKLAGFRLPQEYADFMRKFDGCEGEVGSHSWLCLFPIEDLIGINKDYNLLMDQVPDYFLFGKDAADTGYAFNKMNGTFHSFGLMSNFKTDPIRFCGNSFREFVEYLYNY